MRWIARLVVLVLLAGPALAQDPQALVGQMITPNTNVVLYSAPQSGFFTKQVPSGIVTPAPGGTTYYQLTPDQNDYVVGGGQASGSMLVTNYRTIVANGQIQHWLEVTTGPTRGWIQYQPGLIAPSN